MASISIEDFCKKYSQLKAAEIIGCSQSAISQMIQSKRNIIFSENADGVFSCHEIKIPKSKKAA
jgi:predicted transcriptional regulator